MLWTSQYYSYSVIIIHIFTHMLYREPSVISGNAHGFEAGCRKHSHKSLSFIAVNALM